MAAQVLNKQIMVANLVSVSYQSKHAILIYVVVVVTWVSMVTLALVCVLSTVSVTNAHVSR